LFIKLSHICINTESLEEAENFFVNILGFKVVYRFIRDGFQYGIFLACSGGTFLEIFLSKNTSPADEKSQIRHICFQVKSISRLRQKLSSANIEFKESIGSIDNVVQLWVLAPGNLPIEFHEYSSSNQPQFRFV